MPSNKKAPLKKSVQKSPAPAKAKAKTAVPVAQSAKRAEANKAVVAKPAVVSKISKGSSAKKPALQPAPKSKSGQPVSKPVPKSAARKPVVAVAAKTGKNAAKEVAKKPVPSAKAKVAPVSKPVKSVVSTKPAAKQVGKQIAKPAPKKGAAKAPAKPVVKPVVKVAPKVAPKAKASAAVSSSKTATSKSVSGKPVSSGKAPQKELKGASGKKSSSGIKAPTLGKGSNSGNKPAAPGKPNSAFLKKQKAKLLELREILLDSMKGVATDTLRARAEGSEGNAFGMHQADAGSDAYDRDFALGLLSQEQNSLYEIEEALKRLDRGTYGVCERCGRYIPQNRLEVLPFTRLTVECQAEAEKQDRFRSHSPVASVFGLTDEESDGDDEDFSSDDK